MYILYILYISYLVFIRYFLIFIDVTTSSPITGWPLTVQPIYETAHILPVAILAQAI